MRKTFSSVCKFGSVYATKMTKKLQSYPTLSKLLWLIVSYHALNALGLKKEELDLTINILEFLL